MRPSFAFGIAAFTCVATLCSAQSLKPDEILSSIAVRSVNPIPWPALTIGFISPMNC